MTTAVAGELADRDGVQPTGALGRARSPTHVLHGSAVVSYACFVTVAGIATAGLGAALRLRAR